MKKNNIKVGDVVTLHANNGLGRNRFTVIEIFEADALRKLMVIDANGERWPARIEGAVVVR